MAENKDWNGNKNSIFKTLGASNHTDKERQNDDYYATEPAAAEWLMKLEEFNGEPIWECASGENHLADVFKEYGFTVRTSDIVKRTPKTEVLDFLTCENKWDGHIITNPPRRIWVSSSRLLCAKNAKFDEMRAGGGSAVAYAWFVWEKGYKGESVVKWFN